MVGHYLVICEEKEWARNSLLGKYISIVWKKEIFNFHLNHRVSWIQLTMYNIEVQSHRC